jgi:hypothetical protein
MQLKPLRRGRIRTHDHQVPEADALPMSHAATPPRRHAATFVRIFLEIFLLN